MKKIATDTLKHMLSRQMKYQYYFYSFMVLFISYTDGYISKYNIYLLCIAVYLEGKKENKKICIIKYV